MRTRLPGTTDRMRAAAGLALALLLLTGCAAGSAPTPTHTVPAVSDGVGQDVVLLNCGTFVPIRAAADLLGLPVADVIEEEYPAAGSSAGDVVAAMAAQAVRLAGAHRCRYVPAGATAGATAGAKSGGPEVVVTVLPDGATEFGRIEPDLNAGAGLVPAPLGQQAFSACDGDASGCRAEVLAGGTWLSISLRTPDPDPAAFQDFATGVVDSLGALTLTPAARPARPECGTLVSPRDLSGPGALVDPIGGDALVLDDRASPGVAAQVRGGLVACAWSGAGGSGVIELAILPDAAVAWADRLPTDLPTPIDLQPVDLADAIGARWPASGVESLAGCAADQCQVTVLADGVWLTVTTTGAAGLSGTTALAAAVYARYAAAA